MTDTFLMIENPGVASPEAFTILGATTKRNSQNSNIIGTFGSGNKNGVATCLRHKLTPSIFCGNLRLEFGTRQMQMDGTSFDRVQVKYGGKDNTGVNRSNTEDLGFVLDYGAQDWLTIELALREFVSNSIDRSVQEADGAFAINYMKQNNLDPSYLEESKRQDMSIALNEYRQMPGYMPWSNVVLKIVDENRVRAKADCTRVFIPVNSDVFKFYEDIGSWFLHFSEPHLLRETILPKANRNLGANKTAVVYRRGVRVREVRAGELPSLFDYNLEGLKLDESRQVDEYTVKSMATMALASAESPHIQQLFMSFDGDKKKFWEHTFESYNLYDWVPGGDTAMKKRKENWSHAARQVFGDALVVGTDTQAEMAKRKGRNTHRMPLTYAFACDRFTEQTAIHVLSLDDREGRDIIEAMPDANVALKMVWECLEAFGLTKGKPCPSVFCFNQMMSAETMLMGFQRGDSIYLNADMCTAAGDAKNLNDRLVQTCVEEVSHYVTNATDNSRDFQDFAFLLAMKLMKFRIGV